MFLLLLTAQLGCRPAVLPDPEVTRVDPPFAYTGDDQPISILGARFYPQVGVSAVTGAPEVDAAFSAWLVRGPERHALDDVRIDDGSRLRATVGRGLEPGTWDLQVEGPTGRTDELRDAFVITRDRATHVAVSADSPQIALGGEVQLAIEVVAVDGTPVPVPLDVSVHTASAAAPLFTSTTLEGVHAVPGGLTGSLWDGIADLGVVPAGIGPLHVYVEPLGDAPLLGSEVQVQVDPGTDWTVDIDIPGAPGATFVAGEALGALVTLRHPDGTAADTAQRLTLATTCSGWIGERSVRGTTELHVVPRFACEQDRVQVLQGPSGASAHYAVVPGPADHFAVEVEREVYRAGEVLQARVFPEDAFGNPAEWSGSVALEASTGGLGDTSCTRPFSSLDCEAMVTLAGDPVTITATGSDGLVGSTDGLVVLADPVPVAVEVSVQGPAVAGAPARVDVVARDTWGNAIDGADLGPLAVSDDLLEAQCTPLQAGASFDCALFTARPDAVLTASLSADGIAAESEPFEVVNGPLAEVLIGGDTITVAGETLELTLEGHDAWGNPYVVQSDAHVTLTDDTATWSTSTATLGADGTAVASGSLTAAGTTHIRALQGGVELGASAPISVRAGATQRLEVTPQAQWAWTSEPVWVQTEAVDAWGNRTSWGGRVVLASRHTAAPDVGLSLKGGKGTAPFTWAETAFTDILDASGGGWTGSSSPIAVVRDCGAANPTAALHVGGAAEATTCLDPYGDAVVTADMSASTRGATSLVGYAAGTQGGLAGTEAGPLIDLVVHGTGPHTLAGLAVDEAGCGDEATAVVWAGPLDGTPVGPIALTTAAGQIGDSDTADIVLTGVVDCSGDRASGQEVRLRATGGALTGVAPTGSGLAVLLDGAGNGSATLTTAGGLSDGLLELEAWVPSGAAGGTLALPLVGDAVRPTVYGQDPSGQTSGSVADVVLAFSEPLLGSTAGPASFAVQGPHPATVERTELGPAGRTVRLELAAPVDADAGAWSVVASSDLRDERGNLLSGDGSGGVASYLGWFGDVGGGVGAASCIPATASFRPDGDPGPGAEADELTVDVWSPTAPAVWVVQVEDASVVVQHRHAALGAVDAVTWDGRGADGLVVPNGSYTVRVWPEDDVGNRGGACVFGAAVDNAERP